MAAPNTFSHSKPLARRDTASSLLSQFLPGAKTEHKMDAQKFKGNNSEVSHAGYNNTPTGISFPTTPTQHSYIDLEADAQTTLPPADEEAIEYTPKSKSGRSLRPRSSLPQSLKALENGDKPRSKTPRTSKKKNAISDLIGGDIAGFNFSPVVSQRVLIRQEIASHTAANRSRFFVEKKDYFLPLLPPSNHVKKLVEKHDQLSAEEISKLPMITPYEEIENQPKGIEATMKPYQLSGLSFMVYLHRNGLSGILGDEMGLGKTLQTLSLIQYLKENDPKRGTGRLQRPFLVICPLSVLSSWMAEARRWAPGLKVVRFHGPIKERVRLKKIIVGEIDMYGNPTAQARSKLKSKGYAAGQTVISLDGEGEDVGVDVVVTTYESYAAEDSWFKKAFVWRYVVLDEGHKVKNDQSLISMSLQGLKAEYRLILTGTPLQNNLSEAWALLHWLYPEVFIENTGDLFHNSFNLSKGLYSNTVLDDLRHLLELIMLRRMKTSPGVDLNLPPKTEVLLFVPLSPMQRFWYQRLITRADQGLLDELFRGAKDKEQQDMDLAKKNEAMEAELIKREAAALENMESQLVLGSDSWKESREILRQTIQREQEQDQNEGSAKKSAWQKLMNLLMQLRKVCNHPYQIQYPEDLAMGDHVVTASGKFIILEKLLNELVVKQKKKILIFSGFTRMLDLVEELLQVRGGDGSSYRFVRLDGSTQRARRNLGIRMFNDTSSEFRVMLISTRAGGLGVNLATASDVVLLDQDWNPQITLQAEARAHRIGQKNPVTIYKLVSQGTVEEQMMGRIQKKLYLSAKVTEAMQDIHTKSGVKSGKGKGRASGNDEDMGPQLDTSELMALVRRGASAISRPEIDVNEMLKWDWETTVAKCKDQPADINVKKDALPDATVDEDAEKKWLSEMEKVEASIFEGKKMMRGIRPTGSYNDIAQEWNREDRRIGKNTTVMIDGFAVNKESMLCGDWEAVPTMAGKDPRLAEPKRAKKVRGDPQSHCQICFDGGELQCCQLCPRAYHYDCLDREFQARVKGWQFNCPQHQCQDCEQKTTDAGGMLYRCRWCERAYCEDCLDFEKTILYGNNLPEYEILGYGEMTQAFYVQCHSCTEHLAENPANQEFCDNFAMVAQKDHEEMFGIGGGPGRMSNGSPRAGSLTDATTIDTPGVSTPIDLEDEYENNGGKRKLRIKVKPNNGRAALKRSRRA